MGPICKFILEYVDDPREKDLPIQICKRPGCGKFILPDRVGRKEFCSSLCGSRLAQEKKPQELKADYASVASFGKRTKSNASAQVKEDQSEDSPGRNRNSLASSSTESSGD